VRYLAGPEAAFVTGASLTIDGGSRHDAKYPCHLETLIHHLSRLRG